MEQEYVRDMILKLVHYIKHFTLTINQNFLDAKEKFFFAVSPYFI